MTHGPAGDPYYDQQRCDEAHARYESRCEQRERFSPPGEDWLAAKDRKAREAREAAPQNETDEAL